MTKNHLERLAVIETELKNFKQTQLDHNNQQQADILEIKNLIKEHVIWEAKKYDTLTDYFAAKWTEKLLVGLVGFILLTVLTLILKTTLGV